MGRVDVRGRGAARSHVQNALGDLSPLHQAHRHFQTYHHFIKLTVISTAAVVVVLAMMAMFLT
jgi:hypothetical protein